MPQCELCGSNVDELTKTKVSGAELSVCSNCTTHGTTLESKEESKSNTKYSTDSNNSNSNRSNLDNNTQNNKTNGDRHNESEENPFDEVSNLAIDYGDMIMSERNRRDMSREQFARELGIKESYLRNIENQNTQPNVDLQRKIERKLDIDLSQSEDLGH
jgi:uncharacterized protein (TIGR00270 family)